MMDETKYEELEARLATVERRLDLLEGDYAGEEKRSRRTRTFNMWLRIAVYVTALLLMIFFLFLFRGRF